MCHPPEVDPVLAHIESALPNSLQDILFDELWPVALDKVKAPALIADVVLKMLQPIFQMRAQVLIQVVQI